MERREPAARRLLAAREPAVGTGEAGREGVRLGAVAAAVQWTAWLVALNLVWEVLQLPLYSFAPDVSRIAIARYVFHCTLGDGGIALGVYVFVAAVLRDGVWVLRESGRAVALAVVGAVAYTAWSEWLNVYVAGNWTYAATMPTIAGIGLSPLMQWTLLPPLARWLVGRASKR